MSFLSNNFISDFFLLLLRWVYSFVHDYSGAILILTVLVRLVILPLDLRQKNSARKVQMIQPAAVAAALCQQSAAAAEKEAGAV